MPQVCLNTDLMKPIDTATDEWLAPRQVAALIGITPDTVRKWANDGILPTQRIRAGGHRRFRRSDVEALLRSGDESEPAGASS